MSSADETTPLFSGEKKPGTRPSAAVLTRTRTASLKTVANAKDALRQQRGGKGHTFWFSVLSEHSHRVEARIYRYLIGTLILANVLAFILQTDAATNKKFSTAFALLETLSAGIFFLEYCLRLYVAPEKKRYAGLTPAEARRKWLLSFGALIDLAAVAPSLLQVALDIVAKDRGIELPNLAWIRVLRLFRLLKSSAIMEAFDVFSRVIYYNHEILLVSIMLGLVLILLLSTILYLLAPARDPSKQVDDYSSIPATMYLSVMMLTGQGQPEGYMPWYTKIVVCITSVFAVGLFAIFASMLTWGFEQEAEARIKRKHEEEKKRADAILNGLDVDFVEELSSSSSDEDRAVGSDWEDYRANVVGSESDDEHELTPQEIDRAQNAFLRLDADNSGFIPTSDLAAIEGVKGETLLRQLDTDQDGRTTKEEFIDWLRVIKHSQSHRVFEKMLQSMEELRKQETSKPMATATTKLTYFEKTRVEKIFTYLDADEDGSISMAALSAIPGMNGENLARQLDTTQSGTITRHEFVNWLCLIKQSRSQEVFDQVLDGLDKAPADAERAVARRTTSRWMSRQNTQKLQERSLAQFAARFDELEAQNQDLKEQLAEIKQLLGGKEGP